MLSNSDERSVSTKRGEFLGSYSKCWFLGPTSTVLVLYCSADGSGRHIVCLYARFICLRVVAGAGESWARLITERALSRRKQTFVMTSH